MTTEQYLEVIINPFLKGRVVMERVTDEKGILITLQVSREDMGQIVGSKGQTIEALRRLGYSYAARNGERVAIKLLEPLI